MPMRAVRILSVVIAAGLAGPVHAAQQGHDTSKIAAQPAPPTPPNSTHASTPPAKPATLSRDVCDKHPNLKQCS